MLNQNNIYDAVQISCRITTEVRKRLKILAVWHPHALGQLVQQLQQAKTIFPLPAP